MQINLEECAQWKSAIEVNTEQYNEKVQLKRKCAMEESSGYKLTMIEVAS